MRFSFLRLSCLLIALLASSRGQAGDLLASPDGFEERFYGQTTLCSMGNLCAAKGADIDTEWQEQLTNLDLMKQEMQHLKIPHPRVSVAVIDSGANRQVMQLFKGKVTYVSAQSDGSAVRQDPIDHGTGVTGSLKQLLPGSELTVHGDNQAELSIDTRLAQIEKMCDSGHQVINVSSSPVDSGVSFDRARPQLFESTRNKGCIVVFAAGNDGNSRIERNITVGALDRSGKLAQFERALPDGGGTVRHSATIGSIFAAGDTMAVASGLASSIPSSGDSAARRCSKNFIIQQGSSYSAPQVSAVLKNIYEILNRVEAFRQLTPSGRAQTDLVVKILYKSAVNKRLDGFRAVKLAETIAEQISSRDPVDVDAAARFTWERIQRNFHNAGTGAKSCAAIHDCDKRKLCYDDKRRWLAGAGDDSKALTKAAIKDLFVTAHNSGDFELAQNWAARLREDGVAKGSVGKLEWDEFSRRIGTSSKEMASPLVTNYLQTIQSIVDLPGDIRAASTLKNARSTSVK